MFQHEDEFSDGACFNTDYCVIGAGAAGLTLSIALARKGKSVLTIESGGRVFCDQANALNDAEIVGMNHRGSTEGRFRAFGGSTTEWGGQMLPLDNYDFSSRAFQKLPGWPIARDELSTYYELALKFVGLGNVIKTDFDVWKELGLECPTLGPHAEIFLSRWLPEPKFNVLFEKEISASANLRLLCGLTATGFEPTRSTVSSLVCKTMDGRTVRISARFFILCSGGIEVPRFLQLPFCDGSFAPWSENPLLGRCFADHPALEVGRLIPGNSRKVHEIFNNIYLNGFKYEPRIRLRSTFLEKQKSANVGGVIIFDSEYRDSTRVFRNVARSLKSGKFHPSMVTDVARHIDVFPVMLRKAYSYVIHRRAYYSKNISIRVIASLEQAPNMESCITLSERRDALGMPLPKINWRASDAEVESVKLFAYEMRRAFDEAGLGELVFSDPIARGQADAIIDAFGDQNHHIGATRMALDASAGVVDPNLRLFGTSNVYVCSSSAFSTGGFSNPTHTIIALALRLADHLSSASKNA